MQLTKYLNIIWTHFLYYFKSAWLPLALVTIFIIQNHLFNNSLNIAIRPYFIRRTIVTGALGLLLYGPAVLFRTRIKYFYLSVVSVVIAFVFVVQFLYHSYAGGFLQASAFFSVGEGLTVLSTAKALLSYKLIFFVAGPLAIIGAWIFTQRGTIVEQFLTKKEKITAIALIAFFTVSGYSYLFIREHMEAGNTAHIYQYSKLYDVNALVSKMGIINFSLGDVLTMGLLPDKVTAADIDLVKTYFQELPTATPGHNFGLLKNRNVILIQVESLENIVMGKNIEGQEITPNLNKLAKEGLYFSNYYAPVGPGTTADTEFMVLNSLYPLPDTVAFIRYAYNNYTALPDWLKNNGYHTFALHGDVPSFWNRANIYPQLGYEKWFGRDDYSITREIGVYDLGDEDFFKQSIAKLQSLPQPFMATLITLTSHSPFQMPADLETLNISATTSLDWLQKNYLQSIHYVDQALGKFIENLKTAGLYDNSLILIYGDHGSFSGINGALGGDNSAFADLQTTRVPMIILAPNTALKAESTTPASHLDVYPTVANLLGILPPTNIFGHDMIDTKNTTVVSRNLVSGVVISIVGNTLAYHASGDGVYEHGTCLEMPNKKRLTVDICQSLYNEKENAVEISDLLVKGNLIDASYNN